MRKILFFILVMGVAWKLSAQEELPLGSNAPEFSAKDQYGDIISLKELRNKGPVILFFYRGEWCPNCTRQMSNVQDSLPLITKQGASVVAIGPEKGEHVKETTRKTGASYSVLYDENHKIMDAYHVTFKITKGKNIMLRLGGININKNNGTDDNTLPVRATYIINKDGKLIGSFFNEDHTKSMSVKEMLAILKKNS